MQVPPKFATSPTLQTFPLLPMQAGIMATCVSGSRRGAYIQQIVVTLDRRVFSAARLRERWSELIFRHDVLRLGFDWTDRETPPRQWVAPPDSASLAWREEDWSALPPAVQEERWAEFLLADRLKGFDLSRPPLSRFFLVKLSDVQSRLLWTHHHILLDGSSSGHVLREALSDSPPAPSNPAFFDFLARQTEWERDQLPAAEAFWRTTLADLGPAPLLPRDFPDPVRPKNPPAPAQTVTTVHRQSLDPQATSALSRFADEVGITLNTLIQGAWSLTLATHCETRDVVFGAARHGRGALGAASRDAHGIFVRILPVRIRLDPETRVRDWLLSLRAQHVAIRPFEPTPLARLHDWVSRPDHGSLFETLVNVKTHDWESALPDDIPGCAQVVLHEKTEFPLILDARIGADLRLSLTGADFNSDYLSNLLERTVHFLRVWPHHVDQPLSSLSLLTPEEQTGLERENSTAVPFPSQRSVHDLFSSQVERTPEAIAVTEGETRLTYRDLEQQSARIASGLIARGIRPGDRVGLDLKRSADLILAMLGTLRAGAVYWPVEPDLPESRREALFCEANPRLVIVKQAGPDDTPGRPSVELGILRATTDPLPSQPTITGDSPAYLLFTSGSTGRPKGVLVPHRGITRLVCNTDYVLVQSDDVFAHAANPAFDAATFEIWGALLNGARVAVLPTDIVISPERLGEALREEGITTLFLTTALFNQMTLAAPRSLTGLRHLLFGGEACNPDCVRRLLTHGLTGRLLHVYGPTETTTFATWHQVTSVADDARTIPVGRPIANTTIFVLDPQGRPLPPGITGEVWIGGPGVALGYLNQAEATSERFQPDPFAGHSGGLLYRTGDLGIRQPDGNLVLIGRMDQQVKLRGLRIELGEIESALRRQAGVGDCVVALRSDPPAEPRLVAYIRPQPLEYPVHPASLRESLSRVLPVYMLPTVFVRLDELPLTANGKVDRRSLPAVSAKDEPSLQSPSTDHSLGPLASSILEIWREVLGVPGLGPDDDFFLAGGHSLLAARITSIIKQRLQLHASPSTLLVGRTARSLTAWLLNELPSTRTITLREGGAKPALFCVHGIKGEVFAFIPLAAALDTSRPVVALQARGLDGREERHTNVAELAEDYARQIRLHQPEGPYHLIGFSVGGWIAYAVAEALAREGSRVGLVAVLDTTAHARLPKWLFALERIIGLPTAARFHLRHLPDYFRRYAAMSGSNAVVRIVRRLVTPQRIFSRPLREIDLGDLPIPGDGSYRLQPAEYYHGLVMRYQPGRLRCRLALYSAPETPTRHLVFWHGLVRGRIRWHRLDVDHHHFLNPENLPPLVARLQTDLAWAESALK